MPVKHSLHVVLTEPLVRYVRDKVAQGHHPSISDVVRSSLQTLIEREEAEARRLKIGAVHDGRHGR